MINKSDICNLITNLSNQVVTKLVYNVSLVFNNLNFRIKCFRNSPLQCNWRIADSVLLSEETAPSCCGCSRTCRSVPGRWSRWSWRRPSSRTWPSTLGSSFEKIASQPWSWPSRVWALARIEQLKLDKNIN